MRRKNRKIIVHLTIPPCADLKDAREYVLDALRYWRGSLYPGYLRASEDDEDLPDPMFDLDPETVKVTL